MKKKPCKSCKGKKDTIKNHLPPVGLTIFAFITSVLAVYGFIRLLFDLINLF
tara:strand:- start:471 stop:626 length:156 start_codon:yes stop_codon:yes gene_type:complete